MAVSAGYVWAAFINSQVHLWPSVLESGFSRRFSLTESAVYSDRQVPSPSLNHSVLWQNSQWHVTRWKLSKWTVLQSLKECSRVIISSSSVSLCTFIFLLPFCCSFSNLISITPLALTLSFSNCISISRWMNLTKPMLKFHENEGAHFLYAFFPFWFWGEMWPWACFNEIHPSGFRFVVSFYTH